MNKFLLPLALLLLHNAQKIEAAEPVNVSFIQAINRGSLSWVDWYLKQGIDINSQVGGYKETPLMFAIRAFVKEAENRYTVGNGLADAGNGVAWLILAPIGTIAAWTAVKVVSEDVAGRLEWVFAPAILAEIGYGAFKIFKSAGKTAIAVPLGAFRLYKRKKIIERLINHPTVDISILNNKQQTALDIIQHFMLLNVDNRRLFKTLKQVESMLLEKQRVPPALIGVPAFGSLIEGLDATLVAD